VEGWQHSGRPHPYPSPVFAYKNMGAAEKVKEKMKKRKQSKRKEQRRRERAE